MVDVMVQAEELIAQGDPFSLATMIVQGKFTENTEGENRELLARALSTAAHMERQASAADDLGGGMARQLTAMALDLRYNPGNLTLLDQIYIFYPQLKL